MEIGRTGHPFLREEVGGIRGEKMKVEGTETEIGRKDGVNYWFKVCFKHHKENTGEENVEERKKLNYKCCRIQ